MSQATTRRTRRLKGPIRPLVHWRRLRTVEPVTGVIMAADSRVLTVVGPDRKVYAVGYDQVRPFRQKGA